MNKLLLLVVISLSALGFASEPKESNYEIDFTVFSLNRVDVNTFMLVLQDKTKTYTAVCDSTKHSHGCRIFTAGEHVRGHVIEQRQNKGLFTSAGTWVDLFWIDDKGKPKHEEWTVNSMNAYSPSPVVPENDQKPAKASTTADVEISSTPSGADIEIDDNFVGSTPSTIGVAPGEHNIAVKKTGFLTWQRKVTITGGHINVNAELAPNTK